MKAIGFTVGVILNMVTLDIVQKNVKLTIKSLTINRSEGLRVDGSQW